MNNLATIYKVFPKACSDWAMVKDLFPNGIPCNEVKFNQTQLCPDSLFGWKIDFSCCNLAQIKAIVRFMRKYGFDDSIDLTEIEVIIAEKNVEKALANNNVEVSCQDVWMSQLVCENANTLKPINIEIDGLSAHLIVILMQLALRYPDLNNRQLIEDAVKISMQFINLLANDNDLIKSFYLAGFGEEVKQVVNPHSFLE